MDSTTPRWTAHDLMTLRSFPGMGPINVLRLMSAFDALDAVRSAPTETLAPQVGAHRAAAMTNETAWTHAAAVASRAIESAKRVGARVVAISDENYPRALRDLRDAPPVLFLKGSFYSSERSVACVGTRAPTEFGVRAARGIARYFAHHGWSVVSGLALGVDACSHRGAIAAKGHTVAVLANGLDRVYPFEHTKLAEEILATGGALVSEHPCGTPPSAGALLQRNRIQSGLARGTIVMQSDLMGGTMQTVQYTFLQRRLLAVPVPGGEHAEVAASRALVALARQTGPELVHTLHAKGEYAKVLRTEFASKPPAFAIEEIPALDTLAALLSPS